MAAPAYDFSTRLTVDQLCQMLDALKLKRTNFDNLWQTTKDLFWPDGRDFNVKRDPGTSRTQHVYDPTGILSLEKWASVLEYLTTPRGARWQGIKTSITELNDEDEVKAYTQQLTDILFRTRNATMGLFEDQQHQRNKYLSFGNGCLQVMPAKSGRGAAYRAIHIGDVWIAEDDEGKVDTHFRRYEMTAHQALRKWGKDRAPETARRLAERGELFEPFEVLHVVMPRDDFDPERRDARGMAFESWEIDLDRKAPILSEDGDESEGTPESPYIYTRFANGADEVYSRGPATWTLPTNLSLQEQRRTHLKQGNKAVEPPLLSSAFGMRTDGRGTLNLRNGALNAGWLDARGQPLVRPMDNGFKYEISKDMIEDEREVIETAFLNRLWDALVDNPQMTATQALLIAREKASLIGPPISRLQARGLGPMTERELGILTRQGALPQPPPVLLEADAEIEYVYESEATRLQRETEANRTRVWLEDCQLIGAVTGDPTVAEIPNGEEMARDMADWRGVPPSHIRSERDVSKRMEAAAKAKQEQDERDSFKDTAQGAQALAAAAAQQPVLQ